MVTEGKFSNGILCKMHVELGPELTNETGVNTDFTPVGVEKISPGNVTRTVKPFDKAHVRN